MSSNSNATGQHTNSAREQSKHEKQSQTSKLISERTESAIAVDIGDFEQILQRRLAQLEIRATPVAGKESKETKHETTAVLESALQSNMRAGNKQRAQSRLISLARLLKPRLGACTFRIQRTASKTLRAELATLREAHFANAFLSSTSVMVPSPFSSMAVKVFLSIASSSWPR